MAEDIRHCRVYSACEVVANVDGAAAVAAKHAFETSTLSLGLSSVMGEVAFKAGRRAEEMRPLVPPQDERCNGCLMQYIPDHAEGPVSPN